MNSFVFNRKKLDLVWVMFMLISFMLSGTLGLAEDGFSADQIKARFVDFVSKEDFSGLREYFNQLETQAIESDDIFLIEYYLALADSLYLDNLEKKELWQDYYDNMDELDEQIIQTAAKYASAAITGELIDLQYLAQKAYLRDENEQASQEVFDNFVNNVIAYTEKTGDIKKFQEVAKIIASEGRKHQLNQLFVAYKDYLIANNADASSARRLQEIADGYLSAGQIDMAIVVYGHYIDFVLLRYSKLDAKIVLMNICDKFRDYGFCPALDADFAEQIYAKAEKSFGQEVFTEAEIFDRGLNLETLSDYKRAQEEYKQFIKSSAQSQFLAEVYTRLGILNLFYLGQIDQGLDYLEKVNNEFADSDYADFCAYQAGLVTQWKGDKQKAGELFTRLINKAKAFSLQAAERKQEIDNEIPIKNEVAYPLDMMFSAQGSNIVMTLKSIPQNGFLEETVNWQATAQDFSVGTVQPTFNFEWFWDKGSNNLPGNVTEFSTTYAAALPKLLCLSAKTEGSENAVCRSVWMHDIVINMPAGKKAKLGQPVEFSVNIFPASIQEKDMRWSWNINGQELVLSQERSFSHVFEQAGDYQAELLITIKDKKISKKFSFAIE
ncbi:MAG: PKD domain-containing protein [Candidatus Omnitrophota bacterium]